MALNQRDRVGDAVDLAELAELDIEQTEDVGGALRRVRAETRRVVLAEGGEPVAALIPIEDLLLLLRLEDDELDRIDAEEILKRRADPDEKPIPWDEAERLLAR